MGKRVKVVGSGLAGATAAYRLQRQGHDVEVFDAAPQWGGQLRGADCAGILYEPHGAHIFHTKDAEVWAFVSSLVTMLPYRHRVMSDVFDRQLSWPPQLHELQLLPEWEQIQAELAARPSQPDGANFESWCVGLMGPTLYHAFIAEYTAKQWGRDPRNLSAIWAPKRIELRSDGYTDLFRDPYQGWPDGGYIQLIDKLLAGLPVTMGVQVDFNNYIDFAGDADAVIFTGSLDAFFSDQLGSLEWRGVSFITRYMPDIEHYLPCGVLNTPSSGVPYTRIIETKWMSGQEQLGTVVSYEYPGAHAKHYPVEDAAGENRKLQQAYERLCDEMPGPPLVRAGRLATYTYIDMDQAVRQGMNAAQRVARLSR